MVSLFVLVFVVQQPHVWVGVGQRYEVLCDLSPSTTSTLVVVAESFQAPPKPHQIASLQITAAVQSPESANLTTSRAAEERGWQGKLTSVAAAEVDLQGILKPTGNADDLIDATAKGYMPVPPPAVDEGGLDAEQNAGDELDFGNATNFTFRITGDNGFMSLNGSGVMIPNPSTLAMSCVGTPQVTCRVSR